jgi:hypothetical protein
VLCTCCQSTTVIPLRFSINRPMISRHAHVPYKLHFSALVFSRAESNTALDLALEWSDKIVSVLLEEKREQLSTCTVLCGVYCER